MKKIKILLLLLFVIFNQACFNSTNNSSLQVVGGELLQSQLVMRDANLRIVTPIASNQPIISFLVTSIHADNLEINDLTFTTLDTKEKFNNWNIYYLVIESESSISLSTSKDVIKLYKITVKINDEVLDISFGNFIYSRIKDPRTNDIMFLNTPVGIKGDEQIVYSIEIKETIKVTNIKFSNNIPITKINNQEMKNFIKNGFNKNDQLFLRIEDNRFTNMNKYSLINTDLIIEFETIDGQKRCSLSSTYTTIFDVSLMEFKEYLKHK